MFTLCVAKLCVAKKSEKKSSDKQIDEIDVTVKPTNIYQQLKRPLWEVLPTLFAQVMLFTIYTTTLNGKGGKQAPEAMFYITSVVTLLAYISKVDPLKEAKDSALFWAKVYSVKSDEKLFVRMRLLILFFGDVYVNQYMLVWIFVWLPFQVSIDDKEAAVGFVLNLVAIFYVIEMDDLNEEEKKKKIKLKGPYLKVPNTNDCDGVEKEQAPPDTRNDGDDLEIGLGAHDLSHQF